MTKNKLSKIILIIALIMVAVAWRLINYRLSIAPNLELITVVSVLGAITFGWSAGLIIAISSMIISDLFIGNSSIFIFTWSAFAIIGLSASLLKRFNQQPKKQFIGSIGFAVVGSFFFFLFTNLGVWLQGWYPMTWQGLITCFSLAIPFYRTMLIGNLILVPTTVAIRQLVLNKIDKRSVINTLNS